MVYIVEGIDRVGKTTFCEKFSKILNIPVFKPGIVKTSNEEDAKLANYGSCKMLVDMVINLDVGDFIIDRFHWTEFVYGMVEREYLNFDALELEEIMEQYPDKFKVVYIAPVNINLSSEEHGKSLEFHDAIFEWIYNRTKLPVLKTTYDGFINANSLEEVMGERTRW